MAGPRMHSPASAAPRSLTIAGGHRETSALGDLKAGQTYRLLVSPREQPGFTPKTGSRSSLRGRNGPIDQGTARGRPRPLSPLSATVGRSGPARARERQDEPAQTPLSVRVEWSRADNLRRRSRGDRGRAQRLLAAGNSELRLGRDVYGTADDVDYLDNPDEGKSGLDWFRFEVTGEKPILVYFQLDLLDRDVSANLRVYTVDPKTGRPEPYLKGKDPMEIVHDRERERYSKHISRTFTARDLLPRGQRQPPRLHPPDPRPAGSAL